MSRLFPIALALALVPAACGGGEEPQRTDAPRLPSDVAERLAQRSEAIAESLEADRVCEAAHRADDLKRAVDAAIARGRVPRPFRRDLVATATRLRDKINCPRPAPPPPAEPPPAGEEEDEAEDEDKGKGKGKGKGEGEDKGKGKGDGGGNVEPPPADPLETITEELPG